jgi:hypothetical protein
LRLDLLRVCTAARQTHEGRWTVRPGAFEASSSYFDLALEELLDAGEGAHQLAATLVAQLASPIAAETEAVAA